MVDGFVAVRCITPASKLHVNIVTGISWAADVISGNPLTREKFLIYPADGIVHVILWRGYKHAELYGKGTSKLVLLPSGG